MRLLPNFPIVYKPRRLIANQRMRRACGRSREPTAGLTEAPPPSTIAASGATNGVRRPCEGGQGMPATMFRAALALCVIASGAAQAQRYDPGASDTEIRLGETAPYSGPVAVAGAIGQPDFTAYFTAVNKAGGINGRQVRLIARRRVTVRRKPSKPHAAWSRTTMSCCCSAPSARPPTRRWKNISTRRRCRNCSSARAPAVSAIPKTFRGPWPSRQATRRKGRRWHDTFLKPSRRPGSPCCIRTTIWARIFAPDSAPAWGTKRIP